MGPLEQLTGLLPGIGSAQPQSGELDDGQLIQVEAVVNSMTCRERRYHRLIDGSRRRRIAWGCGRSVEEVNLVLKRFLAVRKMLQTVGAAGKRRKSGRNVRRGPVRDLVQRMNQLGGGS